MATIVDTTAGATLRGTSSNDRLQGTGGNNTYYGGGGNDSFLVSLASLQASTGSTYNGSIKADAAILDFGGAGGYSSGENDFLALTGFSAGSTLTFAHYGQTASGTDFTTQTYMVHDAATNVDYTIHIHSTNGKLLAAGDYNFY